MNRQFIKEEKHVRRCSNTVFIRQLLMKTLKRYHCIPNILSILKCLVGEDIIETALGTSRFCFHTSGWWSHLRGNVGIALDPQFPLVGIWSPEIQKRHIGHLLQCCWR